MSRINTVRAVCIGMLVALILGTAAVADAAPQNPVVSGVVYGSDAIAIPGATVAVLELNKGVFRPVTTLTANGSGAWSYTGKPNTYRFDISAPSADPASVTLALVKGGVYNADVTLASYGAIAGVMTKLPGGGPLAGATVELYRRNADGSWPAAPSASAVTAADGSYSFASLATAAYAVRASATGYVSAYYGGATIEAATAVVVTRGATLTASFALSPVPAPPAGATISGVVVTGASRSPLANTYVYLYRQNDDGTWPATSPGWGSPTKTVFSAADGSWTSGLLALGNYRVRFFGMHTGSQWWQYVPTVDLATPVVLDTDGQEVTGIDGWYNKP